MATIHATPLATALEYPETDGKPMAETETHLMAMTDTILTLRHFFRDRPDVHVGGNLLLYYERGNPSAVVAPDVFVAFGLDKRPRRTYKLWEEPQPPTVVIEFTSRSTALEDQGAKRVVYGWMGVREYFLCDPLAEYLDPPLQGYRLEGPDHVRMEMDATAALPSEALGLRLRREGGRLRLLDASTGEPLLWPDEVAQARRVAEERAQAAEERARAELEARQAAEVELAALRAELERLRDGAR